MPSIAMSPATIQVAPASPKDAERKFEYDSKVVSMRRQT